MSTTPIPTGFRRDIMTLHAISDLMEKNPTLPRPKVEFNKSYDGTETKNTIYWHLRADGSIYLPLFREDGTMWHIDERDAEQKRRRRVDLEERIAALVLALGDDLEWEKNDPSVESWSYRLTTTWQGCTVSISTWRDDVCEEVVVLETEREEEVPDPELVAAVPLVKVTVTDKITEWQCNARLAAVTAPKHVRTTQVVS